MSWLGKCRYLEGFDGSGMLDGYSYIWVASKTVDKHGWFKTSLRRRNSSTKAREFRREVKVEKLCLLRFTHNYETVEDWAPSF